MILSKFVGRTALLATAKSESSAVAAASAAAPTDRNPLEQFFEADRSPEDEKPMVRKSMCCIKQVLAERAVEDPDPRRSAEMKMMINAL